MSYFQWQKTGHRCIVNLDNNDLNWMGAIDLNGVIFSRGSRGVTVRLSEDVFFLIKEGKVKLPGYAISVQKIEDAIYIHVAWSEGKRGEEFTIQANHWYAIWLDPFRNISKRHFVRMNKFVRKNVNRKDATFWIRQKIRD